MPLLVKVGENHWNLRGKYKPVFFLNFGSQMSFIKLSSGKFLVLSTVKISARAKREIDALTDNGKLIEFVVATHPFHTLHFEAFHKLYPGAKYYGTPRHLRKIPSIPWTGDLSKSEVLNQWAVEGIYMRIPAGAEFSNPPDSNHFSSVFVYHSISKTLFDDDTIMCYERPGCLLGCCFGIKTGQVGFHPVPWKDALYPTPTAPTEFKEFMKKILRDWDFDNLVTAHTGIKLGGAKQALTELLDKETPALDELAAMRTKANSKV